MVGSKDASIVTDRIKIVKKGGDGGSGGILLIFDFNDLSKLISFVYRFPQKLMT